MDKILSVNGRCMINLNIAESIRVQSCHVTIYFTNKFIQITFENDQDATDAYERITNFMLSTECGRFIFINNCKSCY